LHVGADAFAELWSKDARADQVGTHRPRARYPFALGMALQPVRCRAVSVEPHQQLVVALHRPTKRITAASRRGNPCARHYRSRSDARWRASGATGTGG
jgi:hypothetical protein